MTDASPSSGQEKRSVTLSTPADFLANAGKESSFYQAQAMLVTAEYNALRAEIGRYQDHQRQLINSVFLIIGGSVTLTGSFTGISTPLVSPENLLIMVPPLYTLLALLYSDRAVRIVRLAHYLHHHCRLAASSITNTPVWEWEIYKNKTEVVSRRVAFLLDKFRWSVFILPLMVTTIFTTFGRPAASLEFRIWSASIGVVSLTVALLAALLTEETTGAIRTSYRLGRRQKS